MMLHLGTPMANVLIAYLCETRYVNGRLQVTFDTRSTKSKFD
jgi:hypothetical protein